MNTKMFQKAINRSLQLIDKPVSSRSKHFSFIVWKNNIESFGWNISTKTCPLSFKYGHRYHRIHSEVAAILKFPLEPAFLCKCEMINVRLNKHNNRLLMSKPCIYCHKMLKDFGFNEVYYSNNEGTFTLLKI